MVTTNFPNGVTSFGIPVVGNSIPTTNGNYWFVSSATGLTTGPGTMETPFSSIAYACSTTYNPALAANDVIVVMPGHTETVAAAGGITIATAGVQLIGLGSGAYRPTITFATAATASMLISGAGVKILNIVGVAGINNLQNPIDVTGGTPNIQIEWQDVSTTYQAISCVRMTSVTNAKLDLKYLGTANSAVCLNPVQLAGCTVVEVNIDFYGTAGTAVVNTVATGASKDVVVSGYMYNSGTTTGAKNFVDTVTGSTWFINVDDGAAGSSYIGGSGSAPVIADIANVANALYGAAGIATWPTAVTYGNTVSIAESLAYTQDAVRNGSGTGMPANKSIVDLLGTGYTGGAGLTLQAALGTTGTATTDSATSLVGIIGSNTSTTAFTSANVVADADGNVLERLETIQTGVINGTGTVLPTNYSLFDQVSGTKGVAVWPASAAHGNGVSVAAVVGYNQDMVEKCVATPAATMSMATDDLFVIAGGPIALVSLVGVFQTVNTGAASTFQIQANATAGGATVLSIASGSTSGAAAGTYLVLPAAASSAVTAVTAGAHLNLLPAEHWTIPVGKLQAIVGGAGTVGTVQWYLRYKPLAPGVTVTAGY